MKKIIPILLCLICMTALVVLAGCSSRPHSSSTAPTPISADGNEKFYFFSESLPAASQRVGNIKAGDLMLYGADCLVLFYESFTTSYSYTRLGYIEDVAGLADVLGSGSVEVTFSADH